MSEFAGMRIGVIGAGATGLAAAPVLARRGARVRVFDGRPAEGLGEAPAALAPYAELVLGDERYPGALDCELLVPSPGVPPETPVLREAVARGIPVLSEIEIAFRLAQAPLIAVTGTNGKTTTVFMVAAILREAGYDARVAGNALAGGFQLPLVRAADEAPADAWIVAEVSSFQLEWVERFRPRVAVITNMTADHLNRYPSVAHYHAAKARLLSAQEPGDTAVLNRDDPATAALCPTARAQVITFGWARPTDNLPAIWAEGAPGEQQLVGRARAGGDGVELAALKALRVPGRHSAENAMAAAAAALVAGVPPTAIRRALAAFPGVPDRLEVVADIGGVEWVNNTMCTNVAAAIRSIEAYERPVVLIAGGKGKGLDFDPLGATIAQRVRALVAIGADGPQIAAAAARHGFHATVTAGTMREAVRHAAALATPGDVVLLAPGCASFDWYGSFEERGRDFKREVALLAAEQRAIAGVEATLAEGVSP